MSRSHPPSLSWARHTASPTAADRRERLLWAGVALTLLADISLTIAGLAHGATESNPVAAAALASTGVVGLVALKGQAVGIAAIGWHVLPDGYRFVAPASLVVPWAAAALWNVHVLVR